MVRSVLSNAGDAVSAPLLRTENLKTWFFTRNGVVKAVDGVSYHVNRAETLGVVGESGCGKSITALSIMGLVPQPAGRIVDGHIYLGEREITGLSESQMQLIRGNDISMIFQEPMTS
ncbi:MAG: ABC transporter ATP-binding protein, partial [Gammaproteobacteria bacterium]|nr:ABC transporter ATP-binding protein [Gammaproteobacteria bacterium]